MHEQRKVTRSPDASGKVQDASTNLSYLYRSSGSFALEMQKAKELDLVIVLKGHHTCIATPAGKIFFNNTGNAGMAKGGSGDVLTGILTAIVGQYHDTINSAILGVYLHGLAGDIAAEKNSMEAMIAGDIVESLGEAFLSISIEDNKAD